MTNSPGLYAAGEMLGIGQLMGKAVCGGMSVTPACLRACGRPVISGSEEPKTQTTSGLAMIRNSVDATAPTPRLTAPP